MDLEDCTYTYHRSDEENQVLTIARFPENSENAQKPKEQQCFRTAGKQLNTHTQKKNNNKTCTTERS